MLPFSGLTLASAGGDPISALSPVRYFKLNTGITQAGGFASVWDDFIIPGAGRGLLQAVGTNQPAVDGAGLITFDGIDNFMKCTAFTLNQPCTVVLRAKQITWTSNDVIVCGNTNDTNLIFDSVGSPAIYLFSGAEANANTNWTLNTIAAVRAIFSGAASKLKIDGNADATGNPGTSNSGGFTLGAESDGTLPSNIAVMDAVLFDRALSDADFNTMRTFWGTP